MTPKLSAKDAAAPTLAKAADAGLLPQWEECVAFRETVRRRPIS